MEPVAKYKKLTHGQKELYGKLLKRALAGDKNSFGEAVGLLHDDLLRRAISLLNNADTAQDAVQDTLLTGYQKLPALRDHHKFASWMYSILDSQCFRIMKRSKKESRLTGLLEKKLVAPKEFDPESAYERLCFNATFDKAIANFSPTLQLSCNLYYRAGYSIAEIADRLELLPGTVKKRIHDIQPLLAKAFDEYTGNKAIKIGFLPISDHLLGMVAHRLQLNCRMNIQMQRFLSWQALTDALRHGHIHAAFIMAPLAMHLYISGIPIRYILDAHHGGSSLVTSTTSLQGKKMGIPGEFSTHKALLHPLSQRFSQVPEKIDTINVNPSYVIRLLQNHLIEAFFCAEPWGTKCESEGNAKIIIRSNDVIQEHPCCILAVRQEFAAEHSDCLKSYVTTLLKARDRIITDPMFAAQAQADCTGIDPQLALNVIEDNNISFNNLKPDTNRLFDFMKSTMDSGIYPSCCDLGKFVCADFF